VLALLGVGAIASLASPALAAGANGAVADAPADAAAEGGRSEIVVTGQNDSKAKAVAKIEAIAGGAGLVDNAEVEKSAILTNADVLALQPGVYARTASGSDGIKISIRGSSINRGANFFRSGALFLFDGLPVTGPGGTPYELFEPLGINHTEILRGVNGFGLGSTMLGGAINYVSDTGADGSPLGLRLENGSYGYRKYQVTSGGRYGALDYYVSVTGSRRDGYQAQSRGRAFGVEANLGYQITPDISTRFFFRYRQTSNQVPGFLTKAQIEADPRQANPLNIADPSGQLTPQHQNQIRIQPGSKWIANKTTFNFHESGTLSLGIVYHDYPIDIKSANDARWGEKDISGVLNYERHDALFGRDSVTDAGILITTHPGGSSYQNTFVRISTGVTATTPVGTLTRHAYYTGRDGNFRISNDSEPLAKLHLLLGIAAIWVERGTGVTYPFIAGLTTPYERKSWHAAPRAGLRYDANPNLQFFANVSRSVEPPNDWAILSTPPAIPNSYPGGGLAAHALDLKDQTATTYEIGSRGKLPIVGAWTLSLYRADVRNELLSVEVVPATATTAAVTAESNASPTRHQGVEFGLDTPLWRAADDPSHSLTLRQTYTYNDFRFRHDAAFGRNHLPGIPAHFYQAQLSYQHPSGFYLTGNTTLASKNWLDYANTVAAKHYQTWGTTVGLDIPHTSYKIFVDFDNLTNKHYGAVVSPVYNLKGSDATNPRLTPGDGFNVTGGVSVAF
jgi:iron complex outermembrane receptor protein